MIKLLKTQQKKTINQSNGATKNSVREAERIIRTWKIYVEEKLQVMSDKTACVTSVARDARTRYHRLEGKSFRRELISKDNHKTNKLDSVHQCGVFVDIEWTETKTRHDETFSRILDGHDEGEKKMTSN